MPRNPQIAAKQKLESAVLMSERSEAARKKSRDALHKAMVHAVESGMTRYAVAKIVGVSQVRVGKIPGMPPGKNARKNADL